MKKALLALIITFLLFFTYSCNISDTLNKRIIAFTAVEQINYINDNLFFIDEEYKLGKDCSSIKEKDNYNDRVLKYYDNNYSASDMQESLAYCSIDKPKNIYVDMDYMICFDGSINSLFNSKYIITKFYSSINNFTFFGLTIGDDYSLISEKLLERDYELRKVTDKNLQFIHGCLNINIKLDEESHIKSMTFEICKSIDTSTIAHLFTDKRVKTTRENIYRYIIPFEVKKSDIYKSFIYLQLERYLDVNKEYLSKISFGGQFSYTKYESYDSEYIKSWYTSDSIIMRSQIYLHQMYINSSLELSELSDDPVQSRNFDAYVSREFKLFHTVIYVKYSFSDGRGKLRKLDFRTVLNKYSFIKESIESDRDYEEFRKNNPL